MPETNNEKSYLSWSMWTLFYVHLVLCIFCCILLTIFNLLLIKSWKDFWFIWLWAIWGGLVWCHYQLVLFFHSEKWVYWKKTIMGKIQEKIG